MTLGPVIPCEMQAAGSPAGVSVRIGAVEIKTNIFLAPLSGCSDLAFRLICRDYGAKFCFFEMVDAHSLIFRRRRTLEILKTDPADEPIAAQLLGVDPALMLDAAAKILEVARVAFLDINGACPAKKVVKKGAGAALLRDPARLWAVVKRLSSSLPVPVTVKLRTGYDARDVDGIVRIARGCLDNGAAAIFVHGRTKSQGYAGDIDYEAIRAVKESVGIPVFGTGNVLSGALAKKMFDETGCDGILVARGSLGHPWIFEDIGRFLASGSPARDRDLASRREVLKRHLAYIERHKERTPYARACVMRKVVLWYIRGFPNASRVRERISTTKAHEDLVRLIDSLC